MLDIKEDTRSGSAIALVHQHRTALQEVAVTFDREVNDGVEKWMPRTNKGCQRLPLWRHQRLLEGNAFVTWQHWLADSDQPVAIAHRSRNVSDFVSPRLTLLGRATHALE